MKKIIKLSALLLAILLVFAACAKKDADSSAGSDASGSNASVSDGENPKVKFTMENGSSFTVELYPQYAPETVENFVNLVSSGFYDGLTFHRVIDDFMAQGGDPDGTGTGGSEKKIHGEFVQNGFTQNTLSHTRGVISMARQSNDFNSASSQFFICYGDETFLDGHYAAFGKVIEGMEVVDSFLDVERTLGSDGQKSKPVTPIVIEKAEVIENEK